MSVEKAKRSGGQRIKRKEVAKKEIIEYREEHSDGKMSPYLFRNWQGSSGKRKGSKKRTTRRYLFCP